jgi:1-acyl-sn-glycerol-3-phosphate acyltransferase
MGERFSARLIRTAPLDPSRRYVLACYPHGVSAVSGWLMFATEAAGFSGLFQGARPRGCVPLGRPRLPEAGPPRPRRAHPAPRLLLLPDAHLPPFPLPPEKPPGVRAWPCTLESNFKAPFIREYCLLHGLRSCSRRALQSLLRRPGNAVVLFPGGASEAVETVEGENRVLLSRRKGFVRVALEAGADLVPVACFGETDLFHMYRPAPGTLAARFQAVSHRVLPGRQPLFHGDGIFGDAGLLPLARPLTTVVGAPIPVDKWAGPREGPEWEAAVDALHAQYSDALRELWRAWRAKVDPDRVHADLAIVG